MIDCVKEAMKRTKKLNESLDVISETITENFVDESQLVVWNDFLAEVKMLASVKMSFLQNMERIDMYPTFSQSYLEATSDVNRN